MLTGILPFIVLAASLLAIPVSLVLLRMYKRAVRRGMSAGNSSAATKEDRAKSKPPSDLSIAALSADSGNLQFDKTTPAYRAACYSCWRTAALYAVAGACYAAIMTAAIFLSDRTQTVVPVKIALLFWTYLWPVVPVTLLVAAYDRMRRTQVFGVYFLVLLAIIAIAVARNPGIGFAKLLEYWVIQNGPATVLIMAFLYRPIRAVGPLVLAFLLAISVGSQAILAIAQRSDPFLRRVANTGFSIGLSALGVFISMIVIGVLLFAVLVGWPALQLIGRGYDRKKLSDQSLIIDAVWLVFAVVQSIDLAFNGPAWILTGLVAFIAYKFVASLGFRVAAGRHGAQTAKMLLLLRVFALGKRSETFFGKLRKHWQYAGGIVMIAGPDLVTTTVEPHEFLDFVRGRIARQFVSDASDVERRLSALAKVPDPDGRYRISEFFCHNDTWQMTMERLAASSDVVLMDLRSFSPGNHGCVYELGRLVDGIDLNRVVFLVDTTTDRGFLETTVQGLWQKLSADSPNQRDSTPSARFFSLKSQNEREVRALVGVLLASCP
jgi:hypothetical protein